jgi:F-type H+-transporting ATPase subunit delta
MAELVTIARPYAEAAFRLSQEQGNAQRWSEMLELLEAVATDEAVASRIGDPNFDDRALEGLILGTLGERLDGPARNLVQMLIENGRLDVVPQVRALYEELRREQEGVLEATIVAAMHVDDEQYRQLVATLEKKFGRKVNAQVQIDPELIGGARIVVGDKVIDATVRGKLDAMAAALAN